jgi:hypothetical protein
MSNVTRIPEGAAEFISEEVSLSTSYEPGVEYIQGKLEEPVTVQTVHGRQLAEGPA